MPELVFLAFLEVPWCDVNEHACAIEYPIEKWVEELTNAAVVAVSHHYKKHQKCAGPQKVLWVRQDIDAMQNAEEAVAAS